MDLCLKKANKELFAIYHTLYSVNDIEMWFDWDRRLKDTSWSDDCYFVMSGERKIGGAIMRDGRAGNAFLVPPFTDRTLFWRFVTGQTKGGAVYGALDADARTLLSMGYKTDRVGQMMCRPTDDIPEMLPEGYECREIDAKKDAGEIAQVMVRSYAGGICDEINGASTEESAQADFNDVCGIYSKRSWSHVIIDKASGSIAAVCLAGTGENYVHDYAEIAELCVLPEHRGRGLAKYMLARVITEARGVAPFVKLFVYVGNNAECLYREMGFIAGAKFTNLSRRA